MRHARSLRPTLWFLIAFASAAAAAPAAESQLPQRKDESAGPAPGLVARLGGFSDWATSVAFAPDGGTLAAGSYEVLRLWNVATKEFADPIKIPGGYVKGLAYSPDGKLLAAGGYQSITVWDAATREQVRVIDGHRGYVTGVAFAPDGKQFATSSEDETVRLWKTDDGTPGAVLRGHRYPVNGVAVSPDGQLIASAAGDDTRVTRPGEVKLWEVASGKELASFAHHSRAATAVAFSHEGKYLASTGFDEKVIVYDVAARKATGEFDAHSRPTQCLLFVPGGSTVISGSGGRAKGGNEVKIWNCESGKELASFEGHTAQVAAVALSSDGKTLATAGYDKTVVVWDVSTILGGAASGKDSPAEAAAKTSEKPATETALAGKEDRPASSDPVRVGIIGLDTSHAIAFTQTLNDPKAEPDIAGFRVVAAYPKGSPDIESSTSRVPMYTEQVKKMGVEIVDSIDALLDRVDVVLLETNDGRPHLEQALQVMKRGKRVFVDKPVAGSLTDAVAIFEASKRYKTPVFSSSSLRYGKNTQAVRAGKIGKVTRAETSSPCSLEPTHPDLFWYGIHGVESLFTVMGTGCQSVERTVSTASEDVVVGQWAGGRTGTFHGYREGKGGYGGTAEGTEGTMEVGESPGYRPLIVEIAKFFRTGTPPVSAEETLEIYAFMEAADESKRQNGAPVTLESVLKKAREEAAKKLAE